MRPLAPVTIETMRRWLLERDRQRDAVLPCVLAYSGMRPSEALALRWGDIGERTLLVERSLGPDGSLKRTKTGQIRSVRLMAPLREDLNAWRNGAADDELVFPTRIGTGWDEDDWRNWRHRVYVPAAEAAGLTRTRPYDLRHSAASLWLHEGRTIIEVATWMGHSGSMALSTYLRVMSDMGDERVSAEEAIRAAREALVPPSYPNAPERERGGRGMSRIPPHSAEADGRTRTGDPFITSEVLYQLSYVGINRKLPAKPGNFAWRLRGSNRTSRIPCTRRAGGHPTGRS